MTSFSTPYLDIIYRPEQHVLLGRWLRGVMPFELQQGYAALLEAATEYNCRFWLLDIRRRAGVDSSDVFWIMEEFFPKLQPRLGRTTYLAFLMSPHHLAGVLANATIPSLTYFDTLPYQLQRFTDESASLEWLQQQYQQDAVASQ
ncbi:hypothetical protein KBK19_08980 [Microvirga sp. STR05]|uniref:STAS/SEC14 domain-containing protein n=1 Tax=Hymenobacter duratus TaxID=2771356 RepID=A0ABR8JHE7_9BACT|nr:hypothetical protein [Hymenobacter duratus]MBD2715166.1 hypothetical protein [Hymenobacter duratus]MBR7950073.1 hypothetical protein [Microvirga sp. STR05]